MAPRVDGIDDLAEIGRGGFGVVYRGRQADLGREVAVKVLPDVRRDTEAYGRFARECEALAVLGEHPNIVTVHGCGVTDEGSGYVAMALLPGGSLADRVAEGPQDWRSVAAWGTALCGALESAHRAGITHRDIKPENVLFDAVGAPMLLDFGIAGVPGAFRTTTGAVTLTLSHAAPEVVAGGRGTVASDVYSLGSTLYAALAGRAAFAADTDESLVPMVARIATAPVPDLRPQGVPAGVCDVLESAMAKDPAARQASAEELGMALRGAAEVEGLVVPAPAVVAGGLLAAAAAPRPVTAPVPPEAADATITGWTGEPSPAVPVPAATAATVVQAPPSRRSTNAWALVAGVAVVLLGLVAWRGAGAQTPGTTAGAGASPSTSSSPSATPKASPTPKPTPSGSPSSATPGTSGTGSGSTPSSRPASSAPSSSASTSPTTRVVAPTVPRNVRLSDPRLATSASGSDVSVLLAFAAPTSGAQTYEVRWTVVGGTSAGTTTTVSWTTARSGRVTVPVPGSGSWYRWQVRAKNGTLASAWVTARAVVPDVVDHRAAVARPALRAQGLPSSTYSVTTTTRTSVGKVLAQSAAAGSAVAAGTKVALGVGRTA